jgi:hypothetical protein
MMPNGMLIVPGAFPALKRQVPAVPIGVVTAAADVIFRNVQFP